MNTKTLLLKSGSVTFATAAVIAGLFSGNLAQAQDLHASVNVSVSPNITVAPNTFDAQDDYVYYPAYHMYYSKHHHRYAFIKDNAWVTAPTPPDITVAALRATPSVDMDFHDSPAKHHTEVLRKYPKDWTSAHRDVAPEHRDNRH